MLERLRIAELLTFDEARRIAVNFAKLPDYLAARQLRWVNAINTTAGVSYPDQTLFRGWAEVMRKDANGRFYSIVVPDGIYQQYLKRKEDDPAWAKRCKADDNLQCRGKCAIQGESCMRLTGTDPNGDPVSWCQCSELKDLRQWYKDGLQRAQQLIAPEEFEQYKTDIEAILKNA